MKRWRAIVFLCFLSASLFAAKPQVSVRQPAHGQTLASGSVLLAANASDSDGDLARVDYYIDGELAASVNDPPFYEAFVSAGIGRHKLLVIAFDEMNQSQESVPTYFQIGGEYPVNLLRGPYLQLCNSTSIVVRWRTDWPTNSVVLFSTNEQNISGVTNGTRTSEHEVLVSGLIPNTAYSYVIGSTIELYEGNAPQIFRAAPTNTRPVTVWAIGDFGDGGTGQIAVLNSFLASDDFARADLWLMLGDNAYESGFDEEYQTKVFNIYTELFPRLPAWPTIGNHDASEPDSSGRFPYLDIFSLPASGEAGGVPSQSERYYSFDFANIHFVSLDSQTSDLSTNGAMLNWLRFDLAATEKDWIVAYWHHSPYSAGAHDSDTDVELIRMREQVLPILEAYGTDLVLTGHSHDYERSYLIHGHYGFNHSFNDDMKLDGTLGNDEDQGAYRKPARGMGTVYVVCGLSGTGGGDYPFFHPLRQCNARNLGGQGSLLLQFDHLRLDAKFLRSDGTFADRFSIDKSPPQLSVVRSAEGIVLSWPATMPGYSLERSLTMNAADWRTATNSISHLGRLNQVTIEFIQTNQFFRLRGSF
jgi:acid phosphatase type 7